MAAFRVVADNSTVISGLLWHGPSQRVLNAGRDVIIDLVVTDDLISELLGALAEPHLMHRVARTHRTSKDLADEYRRLCRVVQPAQVPPEAVRDPKDTIVLAAAVGGNADIIVTGDKDLLVLGSYEGIAIVSPVTLLYSLGKR